MEENKVATDSSAPNSPELTRLSGEQAEERRVREGRAVCVDCSRPATVRRADEDGEWLNLCADHDREIDVANSGWMDEAR